VVVDRASVYKGSFPRRLLVVRELNWSTDRHLRAEVIAGHCKSRYENKNLFSSVISIQFLGI